YNGLVIDATQQAQLNAAYAPLAISFQVGANPFIIADNAAPGGRRKMQPGELVLLSTPQDSLKCAGWGSAKPLADQYVLTKAEIDVIKAAINGYNTTIRSLANEFGLAHADANAYLATL